MMKETYVSMETTAQKVNWFGQVDIVVTNAGIPSDTPILLETVEAWRNLNLTGGFYSNKYAI